MKRDSQKVPLSNAELFYLKRIEIAFESSKIITRNPDNFVLSPVITLEAVKKFLAHKELIELSHAKLDGSEVYKLSGYLAYWIALLKPVLILDPDPTNKELEINEFLAINFAILYLFEKFDTYMLSEKIIDDLRYSLRYRILTLRTLPIIFEAYFVGQNENWSHT